MSAVLAVDLLFEAVSARFAAEGLEVEHTFGWREPMRRGPRRIVWTPGDDDELGTLEPARKPGRNPRPLYTIAERVTLHIEARDDAAIGSDRAQYVAARLLLDAVLRAIRLAAQTTVQATSIRWVNPRRERGAGATIRLVLEVEAMVPDVPLIETTAASTLEVVELDTTDSVTTSLPEEETP